MRNPILHDAVGAFAEDAAGTLRATLAGGQEIPFELVEAGGRPRGGVPLYCYRPLTAAFIRDHAALLRALSTYAPALRALESHAGLESYLVERGRPATPPRPRDRAEDALVLLLERLFDGRSDFTIEPERFASVYGELERSLYEGSCRTLVIAPLIGLELDPETAELPLGEGLSLIPGDELADAPAQAVWIDGQRPAVLLVLSVEDDRARTPPLAQARARFRQLLTALRLYERGAFALGPVAWARRDDGAWRPVPLGPGGHVAPGTPERVRLAAEQEDELRAFANLIARRRPAAGEVTWALARYEMGLERPSPLDALSDHLLALRALLEPEGPSSGRLAQRLATICAVPEGRAALAGRVVAAVTLEREVIAGRATAGERERSLTEELSEHLRAVLRDVLCGHLSEDLTGIADELLSSAAGCDPAPPEPPRPEPPRPVPARSDATSWLGDPLTLG